MANKKITQLINLNSFATKSGIIIPIVDLHETDPEFQNKKVTLGTLVKPLDGSYQITGNILPDATNIRVIGSSTKQLQGVHSEEYYSNNVKFIDSDVNTLYLASGIKDLDISSLSDIFMSAEGNISMYTDTAESTVSMTNAGENGKTVVSASGIGGSVEIYSNTETLVESPSVRFSGDIVVDGSIIGGLPKSNYSGTGAPTAADDSSKDYVIGSIWIDTASSPREAYRCLDATLGAAVWALTTLSADEVNSIAWANVTDKPASFPPSAHTHSESDITDLDKYTQEEVDTLLSGKADSGHTHPNPSWDNIASKPVTFPPSAHVHSVNDISDLDTYTQDEIDSMVGAKADSNHAHSEYLATDNIVEYTPTGDYNPATKKYIDDLVSGMGGGDMLKSVYDMDDDGIVDQAAVANSVDWDNIDNKPLDYPATAHTHSMADIIDVMLNNYAGSRPPAATDDSTQGYSVGSVWIDINSTPREAYRCLSAAVNDAQWVLTTLTPDEVGSVSWSDIQSKPDTFPPSSHTHSETDITDLDKYTQEEVDTLLTDKADANHSHEISDINTLPETLDGKSVYSGFVNRTDSVLSINASGLFSITTPTVYTVYINGNKYNINTAKSIQITDDQTITYLYFDNNCELQKSTSAWDIKNINNIPVAIVFKDSNVYALTDERHGYARNIEWHNWAHNNIGTMYFRGLTGVFTTTTLSVSQGIIYDEDIRFNTETTKTTTSIWYRNSTSGMRLIRGSSATKAVSGGVLAYDNGSGTLQQAGVGNYVTNWVYCSSDIEEPIYTVVGQNNSNNIADARNATEPTINLSTAEWKLLYRVIYRRTSGTPGGEFIEAADFRSVQTGVAASVPTLNSHANLINRDAIDSHPATAISGLASVATSGTLESLSNVEDVLPETTGQLITWNNTNSRFDFANNVSDFIQTTDINSQNGVAGLDENAMISSLQIPWNEITVISGGNF